MHSFLIVSQIEQLRNLKASEMVRNVLGLEKEDFSNNPDFLLVSREDKSSIGIEKVRDLVLWLKVKPFQSKDKVVLIKDSQLLTIEAQNSLLKTLEEPPRNSKIILTSSHKLRLLPTIISRCAVIELKSNLSNKPEISNKDGAGPDIIAVLNLEIGERLDFVEENKELFSKKEVAATTVDAWIDSLGVVLRQNGGGENGNTKNGLPPKKISKALGGLLELKKEITTSNVTPRNLVELFLIKY
jgi:hypothetical protein